MPFVIGALTLLVGAYVWYLRYQTARDAAETLSDAANDVRAAARRFGFRRKANVHPAEALDDARLAALSIVTAMAQMDAPWSKELSDMLTVQAQHVFGVSHGEAEEMVVFSKWMSEQSATYAEIVRRLSKRLASMGDDGIRQDLGALVGAVCAQDGGDFSEDVSDALATVNRHLR